MPDDRDPITGLPEDVDVEGDLARAEQHLTVSTDTRRYGKTMTIVEGFDPDAVDVSDVASDLKQSLGTGGTVDDGTIELQGDHVDRVQELLADRGFAVESVED